MNSQTESTQTKHSLDFYLNHQEYLFRPVILLSLIFNFFALTILLRALSSADHPSLVLEMGGTSLLSRLLLLPISIGIALRARSLLNRRNPDGLTYLAALLAVETLNGSLIIVALGLWALLNKSFRREWKSDGPQWFRTLCESLGIF